MLGEKMMPLRSSKHLKFSRERLSSWLRGRHKRRRDLHSWTGQGDGVVTLKEDLGLSVSDTAKGL